MDEKVAAAAAAASRAEAVRLWEALFDEEGTEVAQALFMDALLRDARADYARKENLNKDEDDRFAHVFEPWQLPPRDSVPMPPPPEQKVPDDQVKRTFVLALRAPPHLARNRKRVDGTTPTGPAAAGERHPPAEGKKPRVL